MLICSYRFEIEQAAQLQTCEVKRYGRESLASGVSESYFKIIISMEHVLESYFCKTHHCHNSIYWILKYIRSFEFDVAERNCNVGYPSENISFIAPIIKKFSSEHGNIRYCRVVGKFSKWVGNWEIRYAQTRFHVMYGLSPCLPPSVT